uniref:Uncharacterized protein n=1 Tax=Oryza punctata TaxID=4537 RepID=A0A0E0MI45_ORYPU
MPLVWTQVGEIVFPVYATNPVQMPLVWTQVGEIVFPVYATTPFSPSPTTSGIENNSARSIKDNPLSAVLPAQTGRGTSTTSDPAGTPEANDSQLPVEKPVPTRGVRKQRNTWCPIHKSSKHALEDCKVVLQVRAELDACKNQDIQRASPRKAVWCPIHKSSVHTLTEWNENVEDSTNRFVGVIYNSPRESFFYYGPESRKSTGSNSPREVNVIEGEREEGEVGLGGDALNQTGEPPRIPPQVPGPVRTPAQHLTTINTRCWIKPRSTQSPSRTPINM